MLASTATAEHNLITDLLLQYIAIIKIAVIILLGFLLPHLGMTYKPPLLCCFWQSIRDTKLCLKDLSNK